MSVRTRRRLLLPEMEGGAARRYARQRSTPAYAAECRSEAARISAGLGPGAAVLEVAPGPGQLALELARLGFRVTGVDISRTMVELARERAAKAGLDIDFRLGDVSQLELPSGCFDLVVTQAAFKNFRRPLDALDEMHRVLRPGGTAVVQDMSREATGAEIRREVRGMDVHGLSALVTRWIFVGLRRRAYSPASFRALAAKSAFRSCEIRTGGIGFEARLVKPGASTSPATEPTG